LQVGEEMEFKQIIERLNFLYHKRVDTGLSEEELAEESKLRREYIEVIKGNLRNQLDRIQNVETTNSGGHHDCCCSHDDGCHGEKH
jgi:uncharacterized protein YnzC (UPF0291/DUF896 family)